MVHVADILITVIEANQNKTSRKIQIEVLWKFCENKYDRTKCPASSKTSIGVVTNEILL